MKKLGRSEFKEVKNYENIDTARTHKMKKNMQGT